MRTQRGDGTMMTMRHTRAKTARAHGPAKEREGIHRVGTVGQHGKQHAHEDSRTRLNTDVRRRPAGRLDTIYLLWETPSGNLSRDAGYLRVPS